jgi:hypothetical protein
MLGRLTQGQQVPSTHFTKARVAATYGKLPLTFEPNQGQTDTRVKFLSRGSGYTLWFPKTPSNFKINKMR